MRVLIVIAALVLSLVTGIAAVGVAAAPSSSSLRAATPAPDMDSSPQATAEVVVVTGIEATSIGGANNELKLFRTVVAPGGNAPSHEHVGGNLMVIESGSITFTLEAGIAFATCDGGCVPGGQPDPDGLETLLPGAEVNLEAGDWVQQIDTAKHTVRNDGKVDAVILVVDVTGQNGAGACLGAC